jgi:tRNA (cytidine32/uridine32-2'-O)-methyltransferase
MQLPVRIVLVETSHPGNIGASARAMKTMGFDDLVLVAPKNFPCAEATARASGADDILAKAHVVDSLSEAIADCGFIVGASARLRSLAWPTVGPRIFATSVCAQAKKTRVAVVFGPEHSGLTNDHLGHCQQLVNIPANTEYSSLNLSMAVQVLCYELRMTQTQSPAVVEGGEDGRRDAPLATADEINGFHEHLEALISSAGFLNPDQPKQLKLRLRRLFHRARLDQTEVNILRGILAALDPRAVKSQRTQK